MSSAFLMAMVAIDEDRAPDWKAGEAAISAWDPAAADPDMIEQHFPYLEIGGLEASDPERIEMVDQARDGLLDDLGSLRLGVGGDDQTMSWVTFRGVRFYITGGMSMGDSPTDLFDAISRLDACGALDAAGFLRE